MSAFGFTVNPPYERSEVSILQPSGIPKRFMSGTLLHSVFYILPIIKEDTENKSAFLAALKDAFPDDQVLGLLMKEAFDQYIFELVFATNEYCDSALKKPISFRYGDFYRDTNFAITATHPSLELFKINLRYIPLQKFDALKTKLSEALSVRGTILDIVLFQEDNFFMGYGYALISREKNVYNRYQDPLCFHFAFPYSKSLQLDWVKIE